MPKQAIPVVLKQEERAALVRLTKRHSSAQQVVLRARVVLEASEGKSNATIAHELSTSVETVRLWRGRWVAQQAIKITDRTVEERLADAPRPGVPARISALATLSDGGARLFGPKPVRTPDQSVDWARNRGRTGPARDCGADLATACSSPPQKGGFQPHRFRYWLTEVADPQREEKICEGCHL